MNILQSLANDAKKKKDELVNAIAGNGQQAGTPAPQQQLPMRSPVPQPSLFHQATNFLNTPTSSPLLRGLQTADKFVSAPLMPVVKQAAQGYDLARAGAGLVTGNQQATHNAMQATKNDYNATVNLAKQTGQQLLSRPAAEILTSLQPRQQTYTPGSRVEKAIFGNTPVQNIQKKVINNYQTHPNLPTWQRYGLAGAELAGSIAQDAPVVGGALKGAKIAKPVIADTAKAITAPKTFAGLPAKQVIMDTSKLDTLHNFLDHPVNSPNIPQAQSIINGLHQIKNDHGLDFINGSHADRMQRVSQYLEQNGEAIPQLQKSQAFRNRMMVKDQGGFVKLPGDAKDPQAALKQEALKYNSADEFVNKQGTPLYRGGKELNSSFSTHSHIAQDYAQNRGGSVSEHVLKPDAKVINYDNVPGVAHKGINDYNVQDYAGGDTKAKILPFMEGKLEQDYAKAATWAKNNGYDAVRYPTEGEVRAVNPSAVKSKQKLTDLYNQAHAEAKSVTGSHHPTITSQAADVAKGMLGDTQTHPDLRQTFYKGFKKDGSSTGSGQGNAFYLTPHEHIAKAYDEGVGVKQYKFANDAKPIDWQSPEYKAIQEKHMVQVPGGEPGYAKPDYEAINKELKSKGYHVVTSKNPDGSMPQVAVLDKSKVQVINQPTKKPFFKPLNDGGYVKLPGGVKDDHLATQPKQSQPKAAPAKAPAKPVNGTALAQDTPINVKSYIDQQHGLQEQARKAGEPQGLQKFQAGTEGLKSKLVDSLAPIEDRLNQKITAANATSHITPQLDRALRADTIAGQYMKDNGLANVIQKVPNTKEFDQYLIAKHAADLSKNGIQTGRNASADKQLVNALKDTYEPHAQALQQYSRTLLDKAAEYGLVSKDTAAMLKEKYPNYVPANRIFGEGELPTPPKGTGAGKASIGSQTVVQKIKGSSRQIESPLASLINKTNDVISQGERNHAAQILTGYKDLPGNPFNLRELGASEQVGNKPVISVLQDGKKVQYETDPVIANAAKSLSKEQLGLIGKILAVPTRVLRLGATGLNPAFTGANIIKDLASGAINSKNPLRSSVANPRVFVEALKAAGNHNSAQYAELVREGAGGTSFDIARNAPKENVASIRAQRNAGTKIAYTVTHPAQLFRVAENTIGRSEEFSRALQYYGGKEAALAKGASSDVARTLGAHAARNNTVNFARAGDYGRVLNSVLPYLNAGIQGSRTLIRTIGERPAQTAAKLAVVGFLPTAATTVWNLGSPDRKAAYDDIKDYEKQGNLIIVPPNPKKDANGKWNVIKIPVSQEIANLNNIVRNGVESGLKDGSLNAKQIAGDLFGTVTSLNAQNGRQLIGQVTPQAVKPALEATVNQNLFTGNKIVPDSQKNLDARDQYGPGTSGTARLIGRGTNLSPRQIDNAIRTGTGGLGQNVVNMSDQALAKTGAISSQDVKGTSFQASIKNRFSGAQGSSQYDAIDNKSADLTKQLKATPGYQTMAPADKAKALSRLNNAVVSTYTSKKALTPRQQAINNGSVNVNDYLTPAAKGGVTINSKVSDPSKKVLDDYNSLSADQRKQKEHSQSDYEYKVAQAKYENDKASGKLSKAEDINAQNNLQKAAIGSKYSKDVRELYGVNKADLYSFLTTDPNGQKYADELKAYDQALKDNGIIKTAKYKNGFNTASGSGSRGGSGGRKKSLSTLIAEFKLPGNADFKNRSKAASLARNAKLAKKRA